MKTFVVIASLAISSFCFAQDDSNPDQQNSIDKENRSAWLLFDASQEIRWVVHQFDMQFRKMNTRHLLRHSVGRYWIDNYDQLINRGDRPVGYWGVDLPESRFPSIHQSTPFLKR